MPANSDHNKRVVFFDGHCGLCNGFVNLLLQVDKGDKLLFCPLQNKKAIAMLEGKTPPETDSIVVLKLNDALIKSEAVLEVFRVLGGMWKVFLIFRVFPLSFRDRIYDFIASGRYRIFGKRETCRIPNEKERSKFIS